MMSVKVNIENMVSAINLEQKLDLKDLSSKVKGLEYNPESFPAAICHLHEPRVAILLFSSGKAIVTGAHSEDDVIRALEKLREKLSEAEIEIVHNPVVEVQNIVASADVGLKVNLDVLALESFNCEYEPEQFPGLVLRLDTPKISILVFSSGKLVVTGAKDPRDLRLAAEKTRETIIGCGAQLT